MTKALKNHYYDTDKLSRTELLFFQKALEEKKLKIQKNLAITVQNLEKEDNCNLKDEGDHVSNAIDTCTVNAITLEQNKNIRQINRCLQRIELSSYGICNMCEEAIDIERLKVNIFAEHCISCKEIIENK